MRRLKRLIIQGMKLLADRRRPPDQAFLIPAYAALGNFIMLSPMVKALRGLHPQASIFVLAGNKWGTEHVLQKGDGWVDDVIWLEETVPVWRKILFFLGLRRRQIGTVLLPFDASPPYVWWGCLLAGIPRRVGHTFDALGFDMQWTRDVLTAEVPLRIDAHETDIHFDLLDQIAGQPVQRRYDTAIASDGEPALAKFGLKPREYIVIQLSAARGYETSKLWLRERFAELIQKLEADGETILLPGNEKEKPVVTQFVAENHMQARNLAGQTSIGEISAILQFAKLVICHDSGLMHIANSHGTPLIALYGPTDDGFTAPKAPSSRILRRPLPCAPCMKNMAKTEQEALRDCPIAIQCMRDITVDEVYRACRTILEEDGFKF